jgi:uncharacterized membrane protein
MKRARQLKVTKLRKRGAKLVGLEVFIIAFLRILVPF